MKLLYMYNKRNIVHSVIYTILMSIVFIVFILYISPIRYNQRALDLIKDSKIENFAFKYTNDASIEDSEEIIKKVEEYKSVKNVFYTSFPDWKINETTGLYSIPQVIDLDYLKYFPVSLKDKVKLNELKKLPENNFYILLSHKSDIQVGEIVEIENSKGEKITLHPIGRLRKNQFNLDFSNTSSRNDINQMVGITDDDYVLVDDIDKMNLNLTYGSNFIVEYKNQNLDYEDSENYLKSVGYKSTSYKEIFKNTESVLYQLRYQNLNLIISFFVVFILFYINTTYLSNINYKKRYILYMKLGSNKKEIISYRFLFQAITVISSVLISIFLIELLKIVKSEFIFYGDGLIFDFGIYVYAVYLGIIFLSINMIIQIVLVNYFERNLYA